MSDKRKKPTLMQMKRMMVLLMIVRSRDSLGRPKKVELVYDEETVDVSNPENRDFVTAYGDETVYFPKIKAKG